MEWSQVVIKWINCLNVLDTSIKTINELQDSQLYEKLIKLSWKKDINPSDNKDIVITFIEDEYPEFQIDKDKDQGYSKDIYIVSLLLSYISLNDVFHRPMCTKLSNEVQVKIKSFLEMVLPYGKSITKEILKDAIMDLTDSEKENLFKTPRKPSLKEFFSSPVARSAQRDRMINERNRELRQLKSELETERFEKADLQEDLRIEQYKVKSLLKKLEEKSTEIKALKEEKMKFASPQSCKKKRNALWNEDYYKKEINKLENQLIQCHDEVRKLEDQTTSITKKLMFTEKQNASLIEKCKHFEISIETLTADIETKEAELINLKFNNEDLRADIKKLRRKSLEDQSFETEDTIHAHSFLLPLNTSETLSSVIDIQLQEAKNENSLLKEQITQLKDKLEITFKQHDDATQLILSLQNKVKMLDEIKKKLNNAEEKILSIEVTNDALLNDKTSLQNQCKSLENSLLHNNEIVLQAELSKKELSLELNSLQQKFESLNKALTAETVKSSALEKVTQDQKKIIDDYSKVEQENGVLKQKIHNLEILKQQHKAEWDLKLNSLYEKIENLNKALNAETVKSSNLEKVTQDQKKIIDDHSKVEEENGELKQKIHDLEILEQQHKAEWDLELNSLHEKIENLNKALNAETVKSSDLEKVTQDQKKIIDDYSKVEQENGELKQKIHDLEILEQQHKAEWDLELNSLHEKIENLNKALNAETVKSSDLEKVTQDQKKIIDDYSKVEQENGELKQKIHDLEILEQQHKAEWDLELNSLHEKIENLNKALNAETVKSSDLEKVTQDQKKIIDDYSKVEQENGILKQKIYDLEVLEQQHKVECAVELTSLREKVANLNKALNTETVKSSDLEKVTQDQKKIIDDHSKVEEENAVLKQKIYDLEVFEQQYKVECDLELTSLREKVANLNKALSAETVKSSNLEKVTQDQKKIIDDHSKVEEENAVLKQKIYDLEVFEQQYKVECDLELTSLREKVANLNKALSAETVKSSNLEKVTQDQKKIIDDHSKVEEENGELKQKIHDLEILEQQHKAEWDLELNSLHEKIENLNKALNAETVKSSDLEKVTQDQKKIIDDYSKVEQENGVLKQKIHNLEILEQQHKVECDLELSSLREKVENLNKALNTETVKSSDLEKVIQDQKNCFNEQIQEEENNKQKLQFQIDQLMKEKKEVKNKLDIMRVRSAKLERTLEELRAEKKKVQEELNLTSQHTDLDNIKKEVAQLKDSNLLLQKEVDKRNKESKDHVTKEVSDTQLREIHSKYEMKLEEMKKQMKVAYNEQVDKLNREQEKAIKEKVEQLQLKLEEQCQKHKEEIAKYKTHLNELNSQFWNVGEKLLTAQQEKQEALFQLNELKVKLHNEVEQKPSRLSMHHKTIKLEKQENPFEDSMQDSSQIFSKVLTEENTYEKQHSARNMHAIVNAFNAEDEEGEVFDNTYLADMKRGHCFPTVDLDRLSILRQRNSLCKPHLKSSYPAETQFQPLYFSEEEIKTGTVSEETFNDSLSQILLPEQKTKKRDRTQPSYKKPGPPTPSKNGGRLSLHGSEMKSPNSKVLKERNADRRATATPRRSKGIFTLKRQDENVAGTPRTRRLSNMFRKTRTNTSS